MSVKWVFFLVPMLVLGGCASAPSGPSVMVLPGPGKTLEQFQTDDAFCRQWAAEQAAKTTSSDMYGSVVQWRYDMPYQQCMYSKGHQIPGAPALNAIPPPPRPPPPATSAPPSSGGTAPPPQVR